VFPRMKILCTLLLMLLAACGQVTPSATPISPSTTVLPPDPTVVSPQTPTAAGPAPTIAASPIIEPSITVSDTLVLDGSSTVFPITEAMVAAFRVVAPNVRIQLGVSGTSGGFKKFCTGESVIAAASRPIKQSEIAECQAAAITFIELPVAFDGISVMTNRQNTWATCMTVGELKQLWEPAAEGRVLRWSQIRADWPDHPITLYGAGADSGT
jgi:phosphate transport system substrate-binding protein